MQQRLRYSRDGKSASQMAAHCVLMLLCAALHAADLPTAAQLEAEGAVIGEVHIERQNVFDLSIPEENNTLYRLANRLHTLTREGVIRQQLLFASGEPYSRRLVDESERLLRRNEYLYDAQISAQHYADGVVDLKVTTRDLWTLMPGFSISRKGGENRARVSVSENNLLGTGAKVKLAYVDDVDRESLSFEFADRNLGDSWAAMQLRISDNSDGANEFLRIVRPFFSLDSRWTAGVEWLDDESETRFYDLGNEVAEYRSRSRMATAFAGLSAGLQDGWVTRYTAGITLDERAFSNTEDGRFPQLLPADRKLVYPWLGIEIIEDRFTTTANRDQIDRTEDFFMGLRLSGRLGFASESAGSDRDAVVIAAASCQTKNCSS